MLWLTRVYGRSITGYGTAFMAWPNVLDDWVRRLAHERYRHEHAQQFARRSSGRERSRVRRTSTTRRNPRLEALQLADWSRARAAGQGGR